MGMTADNTAARACAGALVVSLHLVVIFFVLNARLIELETAAESRPLTWVDIEVPEQRVSYFRGEGATTTPQGRVPTGTVAITLNDPASTMETSFEGPLAV